MQVSDILQLSVAERIQIVEDIWDSISRSPESLPVSEAEKTELDKRLVDYDKNPDEGIEWKTLKKNLAPRR
jgi:putative addiction module component (TIGR02574 family)